MCSSGVISCRTAWALVRRLWGGGVHVRDTDLYEPSSMCTDHVELSITMVQGWLVWSVVYARWLIRCEALSTPPPPRRAYSSIATILRGVASVSGGAPPGGYTDNV